MALANAVSFTAASSGTGSFVFGAARPSFLTPAQAVTLGELADGQVYSYLAQDSLSSPTQREWGVATFTAATSTFARTTVNGTVNNGISGSGSALNFSQPPTVSLTALAADFGGSITNGSLNFFMATTGSDANPGTAALPFLTLQHAWNVATSYNYQGLFTFTIHIANGTYVIGGGKPILFASMPVTLSSIAQIVGNTGSPSSVVLTSHAAGGTGIDFEGREQDGLRLDGLTLSCGAGSYCLRTLGGEVQLGNMGFSGDQISIFGIYGGAIFSEFNTIDLTAVTNSGDFLDMIPLPGTGNAQFSSCTVKFPANFTMPFFILAEQYAVAVFTLMTYTNGNTFTASSGTKILQYSILQTDNGLVSDLPGSNFLVLDNTAMLINSNSTLFGIGQRSKSGLPATTDIPPQTWGVFKDTSGGGVYVAANDGGVIKKVALT